MLESIMREFELYASGFLVVDRDGAVSKELGIVALRAVDFKVVKGSGWA